MPLPVNDSNFSQLFVDTFRAWDRLEKALKKVEPYPIDYDLAAQLESSIKIRSRGDVLKYFRLLYKYAFVRLNETPKSDREHYEYWEYALATLRSSIAYTEVLMGANIEYLKYYRLINDIAPNEFLSWDAEKAMQLYHQKTISFLGELGHYEKTIEGAERYISNNVLKPHEVESGIRSTIRTVGRAVSHLVGVRGDYRKVDFKIVDQPKSPFRNYIGAVGDEITFVINKAKTIRWVKGHPEVMTFHEFFGHCLQILNWRRNIVGGKLDQLYGVTCMFQPSYFVQEGMATTLLFYLSTLSLPAYVKILAEIRYNRLVWYNRQYMLYFAGALSLGEAAKSTHEYKPNELITTIKSEKDRLQRVKSHPLYRAYSAASEGHAGWWFREKLMPRFRTQHRQQKFLHELYLKPMTFKQALRLV